MASLQRTALFVFFDAIERDLIDHIRQSTNHSADLILTVEERNKAVSRLQKRGMVDNSSDLELLHGLDLGDKYAVLLRKKTSLPQGISEYFTKNERTFSRTIPIRNSVMHGRPLTTEEFSIGFAAAREFVQSPLIWQNLSQTYRKYAQDPNQFLNTSISFWDEPPTGEALNNLPQPDYDDTGFQPRKALEAELKKKILGRHPVVTVLGDGGDGKTALTLQTLYSMLYSNDHDFDAIIWVSAKTNRLTLHEISRIEGAISDSIGLFDQVADQFEPGEGSPIERVRRLLSQNKILLAIDNLETVLDKSLVEFASDVPGQSKILFTSRVPLGSDLSIRVPPFSENESLPYLRRLIEAYDIANLRQMSEVNLRRHLNRLMHKPLLVKWFAIGVASGLNPDRITTDPKLALQFCMENVFDKLDSHAKAVLSVLVSVPAPLSGAILGHIASLEASSIEDGLAQLVRFGLIERSDTVEFENLWRLRPFARSYLSRVVKLANPDSERINQRFRQVSSAFQEERGLGQQNRYDPKYYTVRSPSEAISAGKLRHATNLALRGKFEKAYEVLDTVRVLSPEYFEAYRVQAFIQYRQGDFTGAQNSYDAAFDLGSEQPQLHFFYGGFLMRALDDFEGAAEQFDRAIAIDASAIEVLREAARVHLYLHQFDKSQHNIDRARSIGVRKYRHELIFNDLQAQVHIRRAEHQLNSGDVRGSIETSSIFHEFLRKLQVELVDDTFVWHLRKSIRTFESIGKLVSGEELLVIDSILYSISNLSPSLKDENDSFLPEIPSLTRGRTGTLKQHGLKRDFGFLRDTFGVETYLARSTVSSNLWDDLCSGRTVQFDIGNDGRKTWAENVSLV
jgi:LuxR family transcriptional regulator, glucitol operon activator